MSRSLGIKTYPNVTYQAFPGPQGGVHAEAGDKEEGMEVLTADLPRRLGRRLLPFFKTGNISISTLIHAIIQQINIYALPLCDTSPVGHRGRDHE